MSPKRIDAADTVDTATHLLHRLQADGWALEAMEHTLEYAGLSEKSPKLPVRVVVQIKLIPAKG